MQQGFDIEKLQQEAKTRWLKAVEIFYILQNHERIMITQKTVVRPPSGSLFLFNRRVLRYFRNDGYQWRKKTNGKTVREGHERLKVAGTEALNCYYAHGEENSSFQRRSYWMLNPAYEHIVLVHYREVIEGRCISEPVISNARDSFPALQRSVTVSDDQIQVLQCQTVEFSEPWQNSSSSGSGEEAISDQSLTMDVALRKLEEQLSLDKDKYEESSELPLARNTSAEIQDMLDELECSTDGNDEGFQLEYMINGSVDSRWCHESPCSLIHPSEINPCDGNSSALVLGSDKPFSVAENGDYLTSDFPDIWLQQSPFEAAGAGSTLASAQGNWFSMWEFSPEWAFASESAKVIITGDCICNPSEQQWTILFGDVKVPLETVRNGVFRCMTPLHIVGKVKVYITSGNSEPCIEIGEFEFREKLDAPISDRILQVDEGRSTEELLFLVKLVKLLLCANNNALVPRENQHDPNPSIKLKGTEDTFVMVTEAVLTGNSTAVMTLDFLVQELLKDKLNKLSINMNTTKVNNVLSNQELNIIHLISSLGYLWALEPILCSGIGVNFRDPNGWTALHWAAKYGREEMVAALLAAGASAGAVTHPTPDNPTGKKAANIASDYGHKGLAAFLSETDLTSHLLALETEQTSLLKYSASDKGVECISERIAHFQGGTEDQLSLKDTLAAIRNTTQAAARINAAFRTHSFRKKQEIAVASQLNSDLSEVDIHEISVVSKLHNTRRSYHDRKFDDAAVSIQKYYKCWSRRKEFVNLRKNVVKIQAHWRAHLARNKFKILSLVSVLEKAVLRWYKKGVGLRGFRAEPELIESDNNDENDILKIFRKQKVDTAVDDSISSVLSMIDSPEAQQQYRRMLKHYQYAEVAFSQYREQNH